MFIKENDYMQLLLEEILKLNVMPLSLAESCIT